MIVVGVDIGGTKIDAAVVEWPGGTVLVRARADTPRRGADAILAATLEQIARLRESVASELNELDAEDRAVFDPPRKPSYLEPPE